MQNHTIPSHTRTSHDFQVLLRLQDWLIQAEHHSEKCIYQMSITQTSSLIAVVAVMVVAVAPAA